MSYNNNNNTKEWTVEDVGKWLIEVGYEKYKEIFKENDIDGQVLLELTESHLKELNIKSLGERIKIRNLIKGLKGENINFNIKTDNENELNDIKNELFYDSSYSYKDNSKDNDNNNEDKTNIVNTVHNENYNNSNNLNFNNNFLNENTKISTIKNNYNSSIPISYNIERHLNTSSKNIGNQILFKNKKKNKIKNSNSLYEFSINPLKFSKSIYQNMFLPKYGIKNYHLLPSRYNLNEIPSFYFYNKIKLNKSMYSRFVQKMIYRMLKKRNYSNISKKNQLMYLWNPFGDKYKVYYIFEKLQNEWK
eukprot:jgi/Orpsp1_1/1184470/evm.model.c7180000089662.1